MQLVLPVGRCGHWLLVLPVCRPAELQGQAYKWTLKALHRRLMNHWANLY